MASTIQLRQRIRTAQNVAKTTRAMQMIAASKLKRAQEAALSSRPYVQQLTALAQNMTHKLDRGSQPQYMRLNEVNKTLYIVIAPDKGLCGGLVANLARDVIQEKKQAQDAVYISIGKKIESTMNYIKADLIASFPFGNTLPHYDVVYPIVKLLDAQYTEGKVGKVKIISTHFLTIFNQNPVVTSLLPIKLPEETAQQMKKESAFSLFEPSVEAILPNLLQRYMEMTLYQEIIESYLAEQAARMISMQNATNNAHDIIDALRLEYNKTRQARITSEILDISGAEATYSQT